MKNYEQISKLAMNVLEVSLQVESSCVIKIHYFCLCSNYEEKHFQLKTNEKKTFLLPKGSSYIIVDKTENLEGICSEINPAEGIIGDTMTRVVIRKYYDKTKVFKRIHGQILWNYDCEKKVVVPENVYVGIKDKTGQIVKEQRVTRDRHDRWTYAFEVPKYNNSGDEIQYELYQEELKLYETEIIGFDIKNTLYKPISFYFKAKHTFLDNINICLEDSDKNVLHCKMEKMADQKNIFSLGPVYFYKPGRYQYRLVYDGGDASNQTLEFVDVVVDVGKIDYDLEVLKTMYIHENGDVKSRFGVFES